MVLLDILVISTKVKNKAKEDLIGKMVATMREILCKASSKVLENTTLLTLIRYIKENSEIATWKVGALKFGVMADDTKVNLKMGKKMVKVISSGLMVTCTSAHGDKGSSMA